MRITRLASEEVLLNQPEGAGRAQPYYCPFCGEEDFVPIDDPGLYYCESCNRRFAVKMLGLGIDPPRR